MCVYREEPLVVLYEHQGHADDGRAVLDAHSVDVRVHVCSSFPLQQVGPKDHRQVGSRHLVPGNLDDKRRRRLKANKQTKTRACDSTFLSESRKRDLVYIVWVTLIILFKS